MKINDLKEKLMQNPEFEKEWENLKRTCNQCGEKMEEMMLHVRYEDLDLHFCPNPSCPNFALLQVPVEDLPKEIKKK